MKQLPMTPELSALIKKAVGDDVDTADLAVFETIALNDKPLPGKRGTIFQDAVVEPITLMQMVDKINSGAHLPLIADHELFGAPKGRFFHAGLNIADDGAIEMRALFYLDSTEDKLITKLNSGSLDEVSVSFLSTQFLCSECGWDYFAFGSRENFNAHTCENGHVIGENGVHAKLVGLNQFVELSLVARGAADNPKIVGRSASKLAPETTYRLVANGFEPNDYVVQASLGKESITMDTTKLMTDLVEAKTDVAVLTASVAKSDAKVAELSATVETQTATISTLTADLAAANAKVPADYDAVKDEAAAGITVLQTQLNALLVASGKAKLEADKLPGTVAELSAEIETATNGLTAIIPVGGVSNNGSNTDADAGTKLSYNSTAFSVRK